MFGPEDFLLAAEAVLGIDTPKLERATKISLAESALAAPFASFGGQDLYEHPIQRAAVLASRIMHNHPLPDGNKRVALILMDLYLEQEAFRLQAAASDIDRTFRAVATREMAEEDFVCWLRGQTARIARPTRSPSRRIRSPSAAGSARLTPPPR